MPDCASAISRLVVGAFAGPYRSKRQCERNNKGCDNSQDEEHVDEGQKARLQLYGLADPSIRGLRWIAASRWLTGKVRLRALERLMVVRIPSSNLFCEPRLVKLFAPGE
jgi:hypothetical protein